MFPYILEPLSCTKEQQKCIINVHSAALHELDSFLPPTTTSEGHVNHYLSSCLASDYWQSRTGGVTSGSHTLFRFEASFLLPNSLLKPCVHSVKAPG